MKQSNQIDRFLSAFHEQVVYQLLKIRQLVLENLPHITEQLDHSAKMIAYCYGQKYSELICVLIPSKKGLKVGFNRGNELHDPQHLLKGTGKISRYVEIKIGEECDLAAMKELLNIALQKYECRSKEVNQ